MLMPLTETTSGEGRPVRPAGRSSIWLGGGGGGGGDGVVGPGEEGLGGGRGEGDIHQEFACYVEYRGNLFFKRTDFPQF